METIAVVCGATGPLGRAVATLFAGRGDRVVGVARSSDGLEALEAAVPGIRTEAADLSSSDEADRLWKRIDEMKGQPRYLVNAVGGFRPGSVAESTPEDYLLSLDGHLATTWWSCRAAVPRIGNAGGGSIVNVAARSGLMGGAGAAAYAVAKGAVIRLTEVLAEEEKDARIRVNVVVPSVIRTPANRDSLSPDRFAAAVEPESIARVIAFLCSHDSLPITGGTIPVSGWG